MLAALGYALILVVGFLGMEAFAWGVHRFVMHAPLGWRLHASHHAPRRGRFEANDAFAVIFALPAIALYMVDLLPGGRWGFFAGTGVTLYGVVYALVHDGLVHRRWGGRWTARRGYAKRLVQAHRLHHATHAREGAVSFGFLYAPPVRRLRAGLKGEGAPQHPGVRRTRPLHRFAVPLPRFAGEDQKNADPPPLAGEVAAKPTEGAGAPPRRSSVGMP